MSNPALRHLSQRRQGIFPADRNPEAMVGSHWDEIMVLPQRLYVKKSRKVCKDAARCLREFVFVRTEVEGTVQGEILRAGLLQLL
jgi:hypothetical protein